MKKLIVVYRSIAGVYGTLFTLSDRNGVAIVFDDKGAAKNAIENHDFIQHVDHEILEINI